MEKFLYDEIPEMNENGVRLILTGQTENAVVFDGRGPLTIVGAIIKGTGILSDCPESEKWNGSLNIIDAVKHKKIQNPFPYSCFWISASLCLGKG